MTTRFVSTCLVLTLSLACAKNVAAGSSPAPVAVETTRPNPSRPAVERKADASPSDTVNAGSAAPPLPVPLTKGKRIRITRLRKIKPLEIVVPEGVKLRMDFMDSDDILPRAQLTGGSLDVTVGPTESTFSPLSFYTGNLTPDAVIVHGVETPDGVVLVKKFTSEKVPPTFSVLVTRPNLEVECSQFQVKSYADAELVASVCLSLRRAK